MRSSLPGVTGATSSARMIAWEAVSARARRGVRRTTSAERLSVCLPGHRSLTLLRSSEWDARATKNARKDGPLVAVGEPDADTCARAVAVAVIPVDAACVHNVRIVLPLRGHDDDTAGACGSRDLLGAGEASRRSLAVRAAGRVSCERPA